jgi:hypothetical protein
MLPNDSPLLNFSLNGLPIGIVSTDVALLFPQPLAVEVTEFEVLVTEFNISKVNDVAKMGS